MEQNSREGEQLSALMDGELSPEALKTLLNQIEQQPQLRAQWASHHAVRHTLFEKHHYLSTGDSGVADRVAAALEQEPTVLAPATRRRSRTIRPWIPLALAASLATVTFVVLQSPQLDFTEPQQVAARSVQTEWVEVDGEWVERWVNPLDQQAWMHSYLARHDENRSSVLVSTAPGGVSSRSSGVVKHIIGWQVGWLPEGFQEVDTLQHEIPVFGGAVTHLVLSNGEKVFSVFIEKGGERETTERQLKEGNAPVNLYSHFTLGHRITVLGEMPMEVVRKVAQSVEARSG